MSMVLVCPCVPVSVSVPLILSLYVYSNYIYIWIFDCHSLIGHRSLLAALLLLWLLNTTYRFVFALSSAGILNPKLQRNPKPPNRKLKRAHDLPLVSREWRNGSTSSYNCTPFLHSLLTKGKMTHQPARQVTLGL